MSKWQDMEQAVLNWLACTMTGSIVKVVLGALLAWTAQNVTSWDIPAWGMIAITAAVPTLINVLNPADGRYGIGKTEIDFLDPDPESE